MLQTGTQPQKHTGTFHKRGHGVVFVLYAIIHNMKQRSFSVYVCEVKCYCLLSGDTDMRRFGRLQNFCNVLLYFKIKEQNLASLMGCQFPIGPLFWMFCVSPQTISSMWDILFAWVEWSLSTIMNTGFVLSWATEKILFTFCAFLERKEEVTNSFISSSKKSLEHKGL